MAKKYQEAAIAQARMGGAVAHLAKSSSPNTGITPAASVKPGILENWTEMDRAGQKPTEVHRTP
jgi:hypothetical protein